MNKLLGALLGAVIGYAVGATVPTLLAMLWINIFPPDRVAGGPEAGFGTVMGASIAGQAIGLIVGLVLGYRRGMTGRKT